MDRQSLIFYVLLQAALVVFTTGSILNYRWMQFLDNQPDAIVIEGKHLGRKGRVVSTSWIGNGYNTWVTLNVSATPDEVRSRYRRSPPEYIEDLVKEAKTKGTVRDWIRVHISQLQIIDRT